MDIDLMIRWSTIVRNRIVYVLVFMGGTLATDDRDKITIIWEFIVLLEYRIVGCHEEVMMSTWSL